MPLAKEAERAHKAWLKTLTKAKRQQLREMMELLEEGILLTVRNKLQPFYLEPIQWSPIKRKQLWCATYWTEEHLHPTKGHALRKPYVRFYYKAAYKKFYFKVFFVRTGRFYGKYHFTGATHVLRDMDDLLNPTKMAELLSALRLYIDQAPMHNY
jgi:hypothetical protein